jgi:formate/nitrite transporter FocA (FNT family)
MDSYKGKHTEDESQNVDQLLKEILEDGFEPNIPIDFADNVVEKLEKRKSIREALLRHLMMTLGMLVILAFTVAFLFYFELKEANILLDFAIQFKYPIAFVLLIITGIQLADSFLLSRAKDQLHER